jgi:hypothetical protein
MSSQRKQILPAVAAAVCTAYLISTALPALKYLALTRLFKLDVTFQFSLFSSQTIITTARALGFDQALLLAILPFALIVILAEILYIVIRRVKGLARSFFLFMQFSFISYIVFSAVFFVLCFMFNWRLNDDWSALFNLIPRGIEKKFVVTFATIFIIFAYLSYTLNRLRVLFTGTDNLVRNKKANEKTGK